MSDAKGKSRVPLICTFYNTDGCNRPNCTFLHICKAYVESTCDGCTLSHDIKSSQSLALLSKCGFDTSQFSNTLIMLYRSKVSQQKRKLNPPSICNYYNTSGCEKENCTYIHVCEKYVNGNCDSLICLLSHVITGGQSMQKLSECGYDANKSEDEILKEYKIDLERMKKKQQNRDADAKKDDQPSNTQPCTTSSECHIQKQRTDDTKWPYLVCRRYNTKECTNSRCRFLHICNKFIFRNCTSGKSCDFNHRLFYANNKWVLNGAGFDTEKSERDLFDEYKRKAIRINTPRYHHNEGQTSKQVETKQHPRLVCRNFNSKGCTMEQCKWLHICDKFIVGECMKGDSCENNHRLFFDNNKEVLDRAGFNTEKSELELFIDYRMKMKEQKDKSATQLDPEKSRGRIGSKGKEAGEATESKPEIKQRRQQHPRGETKKSDTQKTPSRQEKGIEAKSEFNKIVIQDEDTDICRNNIRQKCKFGTQCMRHHCNLPYHWQYKVPTRPWTNFQSVVNETLEINYCNKDIDSTIVALTNDQCTMDFKQMKGQMKDGDISLRRLSTSSFVEAPPGETLVTQWQWYWKHDDGKWRNYGGEASGSGYSDKDVSRDIEEKYIENPDLTANMKIGKYQYQIDFRKMVQINVESKKEREIKRRPLFKSKNDVEKEAKERRRIPRKTEPKPGNNPQQSSTPDFPAHWTAMTDEDDEMNRIRLSSTDKEFNDVLSAFKTSLGRADVIISTIDRIQNPFLWQNYTWKKKTMEKQSKGIGANEKSLYHGTSEENIEPICKTNFDWRLFGTTVGNIYGQGSYFAANARYSDSGYASYGADGFKSMFVVKALVGKYTNGSSGLRRPPPLDRGAPKGKLYDSTVDNIANPTIFCLFHDSQYYPEYLIRYK